MRLPRLILVGCLLAAAQAAPAMAEVALGPAFSKGLVLQRGEKAFVWGTAAEGEKATVEFRGKTAEGTAGKDGKWSVELPPGEPGGPFTLTVKGGQDGKDIVVEDVLVGDVWVCSGQSNMLTATKAAPPAGAEGKIRAFSSKTGWGTPGSYSIIGWATACAAWEQEKVPIGLLFGAVGGTGIGGWMPAGDPDPRKPDAAPKPGQLYWNSLGRLQPFAVKGMVWWQGENDANLFNGAGYEKRLTASIKGWRRDWRSGDIPFVYIQIQSLPEKDEGTGAEWIRESQRRAAELPATAMVVTFDVTDGNLHPRKDEIARRLSAAVKAVGYGAKVEWSGPLFEKAELKGDRVAISFAHVGEKLVARDGALRDFEIQSVWDKPTGSGCSQVYPGWSFPDWARDRGAGFVAVEATISEDGRTVLVPAKGLKPPIRVRYAFRGMPKGNLFNSAGLPASPFLTPPLTAGQ
jgi:sialate O-acetylesterase